MTYKLPRGIVIDMDNIPEDFDEMIRKAFKEFTNGTNEKYMHHDKLLFIDKCAFDLHNVSESDEEVKKLILSRAEFKLEECGDLPNEEDFLNLAFMEDCYEAGKDHMSLYSYYTKERRENDKILALMARIVKVVINYEGEA